MNIRTSDLGFWDAAERQLVGFLLQADPQGFEQALDERALMSWLRKRLDSAGDHAFPIPWQAVMATRMKWAPLRDDATVLQQFYDAWNASKEGATALLNRLR